jgi:hypothetical protein
MERQEFFIEVMKSGRPEKGQIPITKKGKIKIRPTSKSYIHQVFAEYGWMVTQLVPMRLSKMKELG